MTRDNLLAIVDKFKLFLSEERSCRRPNGRLDEKTNQDRACHSAAVCKANYAQTNRHFTVGFEYSDPQAWRASPTSCDANSE
jgi:hypothetical protein